MHFNVPLFAQQNTAWEILPYTTKAVNFTREGMAEDGSYRQIQYIVKMRRKPAYYIWVIIVPTYIINALSIAGIFAPCNSAGEREEKVTTFSQMTYWGN